MTQTPIIRRIAGLVSMIAALAAALVAGMVLIIPGGLRACSVFSLSTDDGTVYGQNLDWHKPFPGYVLVNRQGPVKSVVPWKGSWPDPRDPGVRRWISRYGSVTFTCYGRNFIEGGMNEAGLMIDETNLRAVYPPEDHRPGISCAQWMQYQLDRYATVYEVLTHLDELRPDGEGWHYLVADSTGACAIIEYLDGRPRVFKGDGVPVCALTNTTYEQALSHIPMDKAFGGDIDIASGDDSYGRFVRMAAMLMDYDPDWDGGSDSYAFRILDSVRCDETLRSVVYDSRRKRVLWKTPGNPQIRWLDLDSIDFTMRAGFMVEFVDVEAGSADVSPLLADLYWEENWRLINGVLGSAREDSSVIEELGRRGLTVDRAFDLIAGRPY